MASQRKMPEHTTTTKSAEVMRTNYSFLWQHLEPTQELQSKLVEKSFITEADKEEINSYRQRFAQNAVIIHRVLFSDQSPISLHEVLINTGQGLIAKKMMQDFMQVIMGRAPSPSPDIAVHSDLFEISETFQELQKKIVSDLLDYDPNGLPMLKQVLASLVLPLGKGEIGPLVDSDIYESARTVQELFKLLAPYWNPLSTDLLGLILEASGYKRLADKVAEFVKDRASKGNLLLNIRQLPNGENDQDVADLKTVHNTPLSELQSLHPAVFARLPEPEITYTQSSIRISVEVNKRQLCISNYEKITTALSGFFEIPKLALVCAGCSKAPLVLCWLVPSVLTNYIKSFPLGLGLSGLRMLIECNVTGVAVGDRIYKCPTIKEVNLGEACLYDQLDLAKSLLSYGVKVNVADFNGYTPLMTASYRGLSDFVKLLLEEGAIVNTTAPSGVTALHAAVSQNHEHIVEQLLKRKADPNLKLKHTVVYSQETALMTAAYKGNMEILVKLMNDGASVNLTDKVGKTALNYAEEAGHKSIIELLKVSDSSETHQEIRQSTEKTASYEKEILYGYIKTYIAKVLLFGIVGSGKTSVTAIMTGEDPPHVHDSSPLMVRPVQVTTVLTDDKLEWKKKKPQEVREMIAEIIRGKLQKDLETDSETDPEPDLESTASVSNDPESHKMDSELPPIEPTNSKKADIESTASEMDSHNYKKDQHHSKQVQQMDPKPPPMSKSKFDCLLEKTVKEDDFLLLVHKSNPPSQPILEQKWLYIIDSGGQPEFHNMLSIFVQRTTACIFVFRMHDRLDTYPLVTVYKNGSSIGSSHDSRLTNGQIFKQFMRTMRSFSSKKNGDPPSTVLLATHRDLVKLHNQLEESEHHNPLEERCELEERHKLDERNKLEELHQQLKAIVLPQFKKQLIYCDKSYEEFIFAMNAKKPEESDKKTAEDIRKLITEKCLGEEEEIPIRWYFLDHRSRKISDDLNRKSKVLSREEYGKIADVLNIDEESCEDALKFFNRLNTIFYFPKALPNVVFLEPQILLDILSKLVMKKYQRTQEAKKPEKYEWLFHELAYVTEELLNLEFKEHYVYDPPLFTSKELVTLFETLLIFWRLGEGEWFVPSILPSLVEVEKYHESKERALLIHFPDGGPQNGMFCSTVSFLLSTENTSPGSWKVLKESDKPKCLKRNVILFTVGDFPGKVILIEEWTHFEIHLKTRQERERDLWKLVYKAVFKGLEKAAQTHHYDYNSDNVPRIAIRCPEQHNDHLSTPHPATIDCEGSWTCTKSTEWFGQVPPETIPWLNLTEEVIGSQQQRKQSSGETDAFHSGATGPPSPKRTKICLSEDTTAEDNSEPKFPDKQRQSVMREIDPDTLHVHQTDQTTMKAVRLFAKQVVLILHTCNINEYWAALERLEPPTAEDRSRIRDHAIIYPKVGSVIGWFSSYRTAVLRTGQANKCRDELTEALTKSFPNSQVIIGAGIAYANNRKRKFADVLISDQVENFVQYEKMGDEITNRGPREEIDLNVQRIFENPARDWTDMRCFTCEDDGRTSVAHIGCVVSAPTLIRDEVLRDELMKKTPNAIGGETEGWVLLELKKTLKGQHNKGIEVIVIKGVADYGDLSKGDKWRWTAAKAAMDCVYYCLNKSGGIEFNAIEIARRVAKEAPPGPQ